MDKRADDRAESERYDPSSVRRDKKWHDKQIALGKCRQCGKPATLGRKRCEACLAKARAYAASGSYNRRELGL